MLIQKSLETYCMPLVYNYQLEAWYAIKKEIYLSIFVYTY